MSVQLKSWQAYGAVWLSERRHALLADEMRVGKTLTALTAAQLIRAKRILILCPAFARANWAAEVCRLWPDHPAYVVRTKAHLVSLSAGYEPAIYITSYGLIPKTEAAPWDLVIADESHFLRSCPATRTRLVLGKGGLVHRAANFWALSGTPAVNHYAELWTIAHVFGVYSGSYEQFCKEFCHMRFVRRAWVPCGSKNAEALKALLAPVMLRRRFAEVAPEQAPIEYSEYILDAEPSFWIRNDERTAVSRALARPDQIAALSEITESVSSLRRLLGESKVLATVDILSYELDNGMHKIVVFAIHREVVRYLAEKLAKYNPAVVNGGVSAGDRDAALLRFQTDPECRVFIGNITSAGTAIDLSVASEVVFIEASWVPGENQQAAMRLQNMNRVGGVNARFLTTTDSLDIRVTRVLARKAADLTALFD